MNLTTLEVKMRFTGKTSKLILSALVVLMFSSVSFMFALNSGFKVIGFGDNYTEIEFVLPEYEMITEEVDGEKYHKLIHFNAGYLMEEGLPEIIAFSSLLAVPNRGTVNLDYLFIKETEKISEINLFPSQGFDLDISTERGFLIDKDFYGKDIDYPGGIAMVNRPGIMRDMRLVSLTLNPFSYNPARRELTVRKRIVVRVTFNQGEAGENEILTPPRRLSRSFESLYQRNVINYQQFRNPETRFDYQVPSLLVVYSSNPAIANIIDQYVSWKRDKGFKVTAVSTQNLSTAAALQNYIQNAYNTWDDPPEHIVLMGSGFNESLPVPYQLVNNLRGDYRYTLLAGDDDLPEAFIGRVSAADATGMATAWNKIRNYERTPYMVETNWYEHAMVVGDTAGGYTGISAIVMAKLVKEIIKNYKSDYAVTEIIEAPFAARMDTAINQGIAYYSFRGAVGFAGWSPNEGSLNNGFKLCNSTFLTCGTLDMEGTRRSEIFFRMGTPTVAKGAISSVGMTTNSTTTAFNNCMTGGIYYGIFSGGVRTMGEALVEGKLNLYRVYGNMHAGQLPRFTQQTNLIGDSSVSIWGRKPQTLNVTYPNQLPPGSNSVAFTVTGAADVPVEGAWVTIRQDGENAIYATGFTDSEGKITHFFDPEQGGMVRVTVTKDDHKPFLNTFAIEGAPAVSFHSAEYNNDLIAGNQVGFAINAANHRTQQVAGVSGTISTASPYINITAANSNFGNIGAEAVAESASLFRVQIAPHTPEGHKAIMTLTLTDNAQNSWVSRFVMNIANGNLQPVSLVIDDNGNGILEPLEVADLIIGLRNVGEVPLENIQARLRGNAYGLSIVDSIGVFGNINVNQQVTNNANRFTVSTTAYVIPGTIFNLKLYLFNNEGFKQTRSITLTIGNVRVTDPLGPDAHGYWIYDIGDAGYIERPEYDWIEIFPGLGGEGVNTGLITDYDNDQRVMTMDLPFTFRFYGEDYNVISICPNGWLSPGGSEQAAFRNGRLPGNLGPKPIIAPFWENLSTAQGGVFTYYDQEQNIFIVQWQNMLNVMLNAPNTFQVILYDPVYYYTTTFDGPIKFQYKVFNNTNNGANAPGGLGNWGNYASVGIADKTGRIGLEYTYNNRYPTAARPLGNETALYITTGLNSALVGVDSFWITDGNNNLPEYGETFNVGLRLSNIGVEDAPGVTVRASTTDEYLTILNNEADFGNIDEGGNTIINEAFTMRFADNVPHKHRAIVKLLIASEDNLTWNYDIYIDAYAPELSTMPPYVYDPQPGGNNNRMVDPGERLKLFLPIFNQGGSDSPPVDVVVTSNSPLVTIHGVSEPFLNYVKTGEYQYPALDISVSQQATAGAGLRFNYAFTCGEYTFEGQFLIGVGGIVPVQIGTGTQVTSVNTASPINIYYRSLRSQMVYRAEELNEHGIYGDFPINQLGFFIAGAPAHPLLNFTVKMKHTQSANAEQHDDGPFTTVYTNNSWAPTAGDWGMLTLTAPFVWNGVDNIVVDTGFSSVQGWSNSGQVRINEVTNGFRYTRADSPDQRDQPTVSASSDRPQILFMMGVDPETIVLGPRNLTAELEGQAVSLNWEPPTRNNDNDSSRKRRSASRNGQLNDNEYRNPDGYNVYRNGIRLNENPLTQTTYNDFSYDGTVLCYYYVTALYGANESLPSNIVVKEFDIVRRPQISPESGYFFEPFLVSIACETDEAEIYYTLNGEEPTEADNLYTEPFMIDYHTVVKAKGFRENWVGSRIAAAEYHILYQPRNITGRGTTNSITLSWEEPWSPDENRTITENSRNRRTSQRDVNHQRYDVLGYNIYKSTDEENWDKINEDLYDRLEYSENQVEQGIYYYYVTAVYEPAESNPSDIMPVGVGYVTKPAFNPPAGDYNSIVELRIISYTEDAVIFYTVNGTDPTENSPVYTGQPIILSEPATIKAFAVRTDWVDSEVFSGYFNIILTSTDDQEDAGIPSITELLHAYPNPFNPSTTILFNINEPEPVTLEIYNIIGKRVKMLVNGSVYPSGHHSVVWNGDDDSGRKVSSGIYLYKMTTKDYSAVRKIMMLK